MTAMADAHARKKPGAKPNPFITDMVAHRKEKNRQAQKALRERRAQQAYELQNELRTLRNQVTNLGAERNQLRHENRQLQQLLALSFASWIPELGEQMVDASAQDAVMIAAKALAELGAGPIHRQETPVVYPSLQMSPVASDEEGKDSLMDHDSPAVEYSSESVFFSAIAHCEGRDFSGNSSDDQSSPASPSPVPHHISHLPTPDPCPPSSSYCTAMSGKKETVTAAMVESCVETIPCSALREKILKHGRHIDLPSLCEELCRRAMCHGNPWDPADWAIPADLFERYPCMK
ncbi:hypothetical protein DFS34DRAFT_626404 [Phlyctochytrium arcticum]|nr:hypothetical protein DFS34DRAFT_626404 [Phlyctochytrium arcticum]